MRLLLIPDPTSPNGVDGFCAALAKRAGSRGHHTAIEAVHNGSLEAALKKISAPGFAAEADIVLINSVQLTALAACRAAKRRTVLRLIDSFTGGPEANSEEQRSLILNSELLLVPSRHLARVVEGWGAPARVIRQVPYAYEHIMAQQIAVVTVRVQHSKEFPLLAGGPLNKATQPGYEALLNAAARLRLDWHLFLFGDGPALPALKARVHELVAEDRVTFTGHLPENKVLEYLRSAKAYVDPCGLEGFPLFSLHALSEGCPVIAARQGALPELLTHGVNGLLFNPGRASELSEAIVTLSSEKGLSLKLIEGGIKTVEKHSWDSTANAVFDALEEKIAA